MSKPTNPAMSNSTATSNNVISTLTPPTSALFVEDSSAKQHLQRSLVLGGAVLAVLAYSIISVLSVTVSMPWITDDNGEPRLVRATILVGLITIVYAFIARHYITERMSKKWSAGHGADDTFRVQPVTLSSKTFGFIALATFLGWCVGQILAHTYYAIFGSAGFDAVSESFNSDNVILVLVLAVLIAPISEEMLMRGVIYPMLRFRFSAYTACIVTACIFGLLHGNIVQFIVTIPLSILVAWVYELSRDVTYCALMHIMFNFTAMVIPVSWIVELNPVALTIFVIIALPLLGLALRACVRRTRASYIADQTKSAPTLDTENTGQVQ